MSHANSTDFNTGSQYNVNGIFFGLVEIGYSLITEGSNTYLWIFLDYVTGKLLWFAFVILFNVIVAPASTISRYGEKALHLGHS